MADPLRRLKPTVRAARRRARRKTSRARMLPTFLIIGAQRAGTTSLFTHLHKRPDVVKPRNADSSIDWSKELHFFDENYWRGVDWYRAFFPLEATRRAARLVGRDLVSGESTPYYLFHPAVPARVAATLPDVRLIALLRNPVERAYSHYQMMVKLGKEHLSLEEALAAEPKRLAGVEEELLKERPTWENGQRAHHHHRHRAYIGRGLYAEQLERWFEHFPREQLLVLRAEDFFARPDEILAQVFEFIGLRPWDGLEFKRRNIGAYAPIEPEVRARLEARFAEPNARLARLLGRDLGWDSPLAPDGDAVAAPGTEAETHRSAR